MRSLPFNVSWRATRVIDYGLSTLFAFFFAAVSVLTLTRYTVKDKAVELAFPLKDGTDLPDLIPPKADPGHAAGNHVLLRCGGGDVQVLVAHMQQGSVAV
ncbi:hypothetical protein [Numidum massiliense]|uniref:hypothetical protein n=1 Tax=Numidum massiliense TaxID=1522315 RepID=UPI0011C97A36|nr:hypothetical protein [Numidum massiliense]